MPKAIGIDLGTTFTCVAYMKTSDIVEVVSNMNGNKITPSVVHFGTDITTVGEDAVSMRGQDPENTIFQIKRLMGREADDIEIKKRDYPFEIFASKKGNVSIRVTPNNDEMNEESKVYCPEQISSDIIRYAKKIAEHSIGEEVTEAVITVPANFTNAQRQATKDAGELIGLKVLRIVPEPTAAALAYAFDKKNKNQSRTVLVYDLGGGTFDVSIVHIDGMNADVKSTQGCTFLGGEDFDKLIYEEAVTEFRNLDVDITKSGEFDLIQSCERAKKTLSTLQTAEIEMLTSSGERKSFRIDRETFEELCEHLFQQTIECVKKAIKESECTMDEIDDVVLVGGSSRIPRVQELLQKLFVNKKLKFDIPPDHAVAHGAAILANSLSETDNLSTPRTGSSRGAVKLVEVTPYSLGTDIVGDIMDIIIPKNTRYPTSETQIYNNSRDDQKALGFQIREGENAVASENNLLGSMVMKVKPKPIGENKMKTTFSIDSDGILDMHVVDLETGKEQKITVQTSKLSQKEMSRMKKEGKKRAEEEAIQQAKLEARTTFVDAVQSAKRSMKRVPDSGKQKQILELVEKEEQWYAKKNRGNNDLYEHAKGIREILSKLLN